MKYNEYTLSFTEYMRFGFIYTAFDVLLSYTFYDSYIAFIILLPGVVFFYKYIKKELINRRMNRLKGQFMDMIDSVSTALSAGYSIENSFKESLKDMVRLYGSESLIVEELRNFLSILDIGTPFETILADFSLRVGDEDINDFAEIFNLAKRNGGDFKTIIGRTVRIMKEKQETESEIKILLSGKKYEQRIMCIIPFFIIIYLRLSSGDYLKVLYHNPIGIIIMTICLVIYIISYCISAKLIDIHV